MTIKKINSISKNYYNHKILIIILFSILTTCMEMIGIGSVIPLLTSLSADNNIFEKVNFIKFNFNFDNNNSIYFFLSIVISVFIIKNIFVYFFNLYQAKYLFSFYNFLMKEFLNIYLKQPYDFHLNRNSAILMRNIRKETSGFINGLKNILIIINESLILIAIIFFLLYFNYQITIILIALVSIVAFLFNKIISKKSIDYGKIHQFHDGKLNQTLHESFGSLKDIYLYNRSDNFLQRFIGHAEISKKVGIYTSIISSLPRHWLEIIFIISLTSIVLYSSYVLNDLNSALPLAGLFAISGIRLMPAVNKIIGSYQQINLSKASITLVYEELKLKKNILVEKTEKFNEKKNEFKSLLIKNLSFKYSNIDKFIFENVNFEIKKNSLIGFVGASGSGKTTLIDCLLGLLPPTSGKILFNNQNIYNDLKNWQSNIGYVPQNIYLMDASIQENIAIGINKRFIDIDRINLSLKLSNLDEFIKSLPDGLSTNVGEKGVKISGGQRQRIGIARALYNNPQILVLDEATNALDTATEEKFLNLINELKNQQNLTVVMITHRISTLNICNKIYKIENNQVSLVNEK
tara:strand:- start:290 stop:2017 length:1728 start_codon:yes stop_codon:yes gene_type:complete